MQDDNLVMAAETPAEREHLESLWAHASAPGMELGVETVDIPRYSLVISSARSRAGLDK